MLFHIQLYIPYTIVYSIHNDKFHITYAQEGNICKRFENLINMEYIFSDEDSSLYKMNRYFGLYLTENPLYKVSYYASSIDSSIKILSLDNKDINIFLNSSIFIDGSISTNYNKI